MECCLFVKKKNIICTVIVLNVNTIYTYYDPSESCVSIVFAIPPVGPDISCSTSDQLSEWVESFKYEHY